MRSVHQPAASRVAAVLVAALALLPRSSLAWQYVAPFGRADAGPRAPAVALVPASGLVVAAGRVELLGSRLTVTALEPSLGRQVWSFFDFDGPGDALGVDASDDLIAVAGVVGGGPTSDDFVVSAFATGLLPFPFQRWSVRLDGAGVCGDRAAAVAIDAAGDVVAAGTLAGPSGPAFAVVKLEGATGAERWRVVLPGGEAAALAVDPAGDVVAAGVLDGRFAVLALSSADGSERWRHDTTEGRSVGLALDAEGDVLVAGELAATCGTQPCAIRKLEGATGTQLWEAPFRADGAQAGEPDAVLAAPTGDAVVAGHDDDVFTVVRLRGASGAEAWRYAGPSPGRARALASIGSGDVLAAGGATIPPTSGGALGERLVVTRLAGGDGRVVWQTVRDAGVHDGLDRALAVAVDGAGDVVASGILSSVKGFEEYGVVKLEGEDGGDFLGRCGNGQVDPGEQCDDTGPFDCCSADCTFEPPGAFCFDDTGCTDDACDGAGQCAFVPNDNPCADDDPCTVDRCSAGACQPLGPAPDGTTCGAGQACLDEVCRSGQCVAEARDGLDCDDGNPCTEEDVCTGVDCTGAMAANGTACDADGTSCTPADACADGACVRGAPVTAGTPCESDGNDCTDDRCDANGFCTRLPNTAPCEDGDPCTTGDRCTLGLCVPGAGAPTTTTSTSTTSTTATTTSTTVPPSTTTSTTASTTSTTSTSTSSSTSTTTPTTSSSTSSTAPPTSTTTSTPPTTSTTTTTSATTSTTAPTSSSTSTTVAPTTTTTLVRAPCTSDAECDDGDPCTGGEVCTGGSCAGVARAACEPGPALAAVTTFRGDAVVLLDARTRQPLATVPVAGAPWGIAWHPDGTRLWVTARRGDAVHEIEVASRRVVRTVAVGREPLGIAVDPTGARLYVANHGAGSVTVLDAATLAEQATVATGEGPSGIAVHPAGSRVYVAAYEAGTLTVLDAASGARLATVAVGALPIGVAVHPDGSRVYVTSHAERRLTVVGTASSSVVGSIRVGRRPVGVAVAGDGRRAFVTSIADDVVSVVDAIADRVVDRIRVGRDPLGVAVDGSDGSVWVAGAAADQVSLLDGGGRAAGQVAVEGTPVAFGAFVGAQRGTCPAPPPRCDDADPFTRDACVPGVGCWHEERGAVQGVRAAAGAIAAVLRDATLPGRPGVERLRGRLAALEQALAGVEAGGGSDVTARLARPLKRVAAGAGRAHAEPGAGGPAARILDLAREALRRLRRAGG